MKLLKKLILPFLLLTIISLIIWRSVDDMEHNEVYTPANRLEYALQLAGENRGELEKVLLQFKGDYLKYQAAVFLIENMDICGEEKWQCFKNGVPDSSFSLNQFKYRPKASQYMDSLNIQYQLVGYKSDCSNISSEFLIIHIERAFKLWQKSDNQYLSFNDFKETLLPYRTATEKLEDSYTYLTGKYDSLFKTINKEDKLKATIEINNQLKDEIKWKSSMLLYPGSLSCTDMELLKSGHCEHLVNYGLKVFRATGIPIGNDFVPAWGNNDSGHSWNILYLEDRKLPFSACGDNPLEMPFFWRAPKIFRRTYGFQDREIWTYKNKKQEIPPELSDGHRIDVTDEYYKTIHIEVSLKHKPPRNNNCAFLCVYNNSRWYPVDWGKINNQKNTALFTNISDKMLYCVMYYHKMRLKSATQPFWVTSPDSIHFFEPKENKIKLNKIYDYDYFKGNTTIPNKEYELLVWNDGWKFAGIAKANPYKRNGTEWVRTENNGTIETDKIKYFIDFENIPSNGLYLLNTDERPFWIENGKMAGRFPYK